MGSVDAANASTAATATTKIPNMCLIETLLLDASWESYHARNCPRTISFTGIEVIARVTLSQCMVSARDLVLLALRTRPRRRPQPQQHSSRLCRMLRLATCDESRVPGRKRRKQSTYSALPAHAPKRISESDLDSQSQSAGQQDFPETPALSLP